MSYQNSQKKIKKKKNEENGEQEVTWDSKFNYLKVNN